jgi:hypothetical protein
MAWRNGGMIQAGTRHKIVRFNGPFVLVHARSGVEP